MSNKGSGSATRLLDEYITLTKQGKAPAMEALLARCPAADQEDLRLALIGVQSLLEHHWMTYVSPQTVDDTLAKMQGIRERKQRMQQANDRLEVMPSQVISNPIEFLQTTLAFPVELLQEAMAARGKTSAATAWYRGQASVTPRNRRVLFRERQNLLEQQMTERAMELLERYGLCLAPVDLDALARRLGLVVREALLDDVDGCLLADDNFGAILLNRRVVSRQRRRFTLAHEIAHFILHRRLRVFRDKLADLGITSDDTEEAEANILAAMLLIPPDLLPASHGSAKPSFKQADEIGEKFDVSPQTALRHLIRASHWASAFVVVEDGKVKWWVESNYFDYFIPVGQPPHPSTIAAEFSHPTAAMEAVGTLEQATSLPLSSWVQTTEDDDEATVREESRRLPGGYIYSLLTVE